MFTKYGMLLRLLVGMALLFTGAGCAGAPRAEDLPCGGWIPHSVRGFVTPDPVTWREVQPVVMAYLRYRKAAVYRDDVGVLWRRYPSLATGMDPVHGINTEPLLVQSLQGVVDAVVQVDMLRIHRDAPDRIRVYVCGSEMYWWVDADGQLIRSGGALMITLTLRRVDGTWTVVRTDEVTEAELPLEGPP